jgi:hypothetical protein
MRHETNSSYPSIIDPNVQPETYFLLPSFRLKPELELTVMVKQSLKLIKSLRKISAKML